MPDSSTRGNEVPWRGRVPDKRDVLAAFAFLVHKTGPVEIDTAEMAGNNYHLSARFVQRGGGRVGLIVEVDDQTDPSHEQMPYPIPHEFK